MIKRFLVRVVYVAAMVLFLIVLWLIMTGRGTAAPAMSPEDYTYQIDGAGVRVQNICGPGGQFVYVDLFATDGRPRYYDVSALAAQFDFVTFTADWGAPFPRYGDRFLWSSHPVNSVAHITAANQPGDPSCLADAQLGQVAAAGFANAFYMPFAAQPVEPTPWPTDTPEPRSHNAPYPTPTAPSGPAGR